MKNKYFKPKLFMNEVLIEESISTASIDTEKSVPLVEKEIELTDTENWVIDLE